MLKTIKLFKLETINSFWILIEKAAKIIISFVLGIYLARILGAEKFGIYTSVISFVTIFSGISAIGLNSIVIKEFVKQNDKALVFKTSIILRSLGALTSFALSIILGFFIIDNKTVVSGIILVSILIFFTPSEIIGFYFESVLKSKYIAISKSMSFFIGAIIKIALLISGAGVYELLLAHILEGFIGVSILISFFKKTKIKIPNIRGASMKKEYTRTLILQSWPLLISSIAVILYLKLDQIMILEYLGAESSGIYGVSVRVCEAVFLIPLIIIPSLFPKMIKLFEEDRKGYLLFMRNIIIGFVALSSLITLFLFLTSNVIIPYLFGSEYNESAKVLKIYSISILFVFVGHIISKWLVIEGLTKLSILRHGMGVIINIVLNILLIPKYGLNGAATASVMAYFMSTIGFMLLNSNGRRFMKRIIITVI